MTMHEQFPYSYLNPGAFFSIILSPPVLQRKCESSMVVLSCPLVLNNCMDLGLKSASGVQFVVLAPEARCLCMFTCTLMSKLPVL